MGAGKQWCKILKDLKKKILFLLMMKLLLKTKV
jgi:hypothetical protein